MKTMGILCKGEPNSTSTIPEPACYTDSDWGGDRDKRRSTSGFVLILCRGGVAWKTRKRDIVALSTTEEEYIALTETSKEVTWMHRLLHEIKNHEVETFSTNIQRSHDASIQWEQMEVVDPPQSSRAATTIFVDNQGAMKLAESPRFHNRSKNIDIRYHFIRETLAAGVIVLQNQSTADGSGHYDQTGTPRETRETFWCKGTALRQREGHSKGCGRCGCYYA